MPLTIPSVWTPDMASDDIPETRPIVTRVEAMRLGLKRYFTGRSCKRGHIAERYVVTRMCLQCSPIFQKKWRSTLSDDRREQQNKDQKRRYGASPERYRAYGRANYEKHKEQRKASVLAYYRLNTEKCQAAAKEWRQKNPDRARAIARKWAQNNADAMREWREANPAKVKAYAALNKSRRRARIEATPGHFTKSDIDRIRRLQAGKCAYCKASLESGYHIDHIVALCRGGTNFPSNLQLCCGPCNVRKSARDPIEFAQSIGYLL